MAEGEKPSIGKVDLLRVNELNQSVQIQLNTAGIFIDQNDECYFIAYISFIFIVIGLWLISINRIKKSKNKRRRSLS